jgi:hypothetical protein
MKRYLGSLGYDLWMPIKTNYIPPTNGLSDTQEKKFYKNSEKA